MFDKCIIRAIRRTGQTGFPSSFSTHRLMNDSSSARILQYVPLCTSHLNGGCGHKMYNQSDIDGKINLFLMYLVGILL